MIDILDVSNAVKVFLIELNAYRVSDSTEVTLYYSNISFVTEPTDTPANTIFDARVTSALDFSRSMFAEGNIGGVVSAGVGVIELSNIDGGLDYIHNDYIPVGRPVLVKFGAIGDAYADFTTILSSVVEDMTYSADSIVISLQDKHKLLETEMSTKKYAPQFGEGEITFNTSLHGTYVPTCYGTVKNVTPKFVGKALAGDTYAATWDPYFAGFVDFSVDNLTVTKPDREGFWDAAYSTVGIVTGKYYIEFDYSGANSNDALIGVALGSASRPRYGFLGSTAASWGVGNLIYESGKLFNSGNSIADLDPPNIIPNFSPNRVGIAIDAKDDGTTRVWFRNYQGAWMGVSGGGVSDPTGAGTNPTISNIPAGTLYVGWSTNHNIQNPCKIWADPDSAESLASTPESHGVPAGYNVAVADVLTTDLVYQVHDGAISDITAVYSNGLELATTEYTKFLSEGKFEINITSVRDKSITADVVGYVKPYEPWVEVGTTKLTQLGGDNVGPMLVVNDAYTVMAAPATGSTVSFWDFDGTDWIFNASLSPVYSYPAGAGEAKTCIAMSGDGNTVLLGDYAWTLENVLGQTAHGIIFSFTRNIGTGVWTQEAEIQPLVPLHRNFFGWSDISLSYDGNTMSTGGDFSDRRYIFHRSGGVWTEAYTTNTSFDGTLMSYDGQTCFFSTGYSTYITNILTRSGDTWTGTSSIPKPTAYLEHATQSSFGTPRQVGGGPFPKCMVATPDLQWLVITAQQDDVGAAEDAGAAILFELVGGVYTVSHRFTAYDAQTEDAFGVSVDMTDDGLTIIFGAPYIDVDPDLNTGGAYVFTKTGGVWDTGVLVLSTDRGSAFGSYYNGQSVAISPDKTKTLLGNLGTYFGTYYTGSPAEVPNTAKEIIYSLVTEKVPGIDPETDIDIAKFDALDTAYFEGSSLISTSISGFYLANGGSVLSVLQMFSASFGAYMGFNRAGVFDIGILGSPESSDSLATLTDEHITNIERLPVAILSYEHSIGYDRNYTPMSTDAIASQVVENDPDKYAFLVEEYRTVTADNYERGITTSETVIEAVNPNSPDNYEKITDRYPTSEPRPQIKSVISLKSEALSEVRRRWHLYNKVDSKETVPNQLKQRDRLSVTLQIQPFGLQLNDTVKIVYPRFGLDQGKEFKVIAVSESTADNEMSIEVWGGSTPYYVPPSEILLSSYSIADDPNSPTSTAGTSTMIANSMGDAAAPFVPTDAVFTLTAGGSGTKGMALSGGNIWEIQGGAWTDTGVAADKIYMNKFTAFAIKSNGDVWQKGEYNFGANWAEYTVWTDIGFNADSLSLSYGTNQAFALKGTTMHVWGEWARIYVPPYGVWDDETSFVSTTFTDVTAILNGGSTSMLIKGGTVWTHGNQDYGLGGMGNDITSYTWQNSTRAATALAMDTGEISTRALSGGNLYVAGYDSYGEFGEGAGNPEYNTYFNTGQSATAITSIGSYTTHILNAGNVWASGYSYGSTLGNGSSGFSSSETAFLDTGFAAPFLRSMEWAGVWTVKNGKIYGVGEAFGPSYLNMSTDRTYWNELILP